MEKIVFTREEALNGIENFLISKDEKEISEIFQSTGFVKDYNKKIKGPKRKRLYNGSNNKLQNGDNGYVGQTI